MVRKSEPAPGSVSCAGGLAFLQESPRLVIEWLMNTNVFETAVMRCESETAYLTIRKRPSGVNGVLPVDSQPV